MSKFFLVSGIILIIIFILFQTYTLMASDKTEGQKYSVVQKENEFEIRYYPSTTMAVIQSKAKTYRELSGPGFRKLAGYIFGGNEKDTKIAMTSPVHMDINDSNSSMAFVMPSEYDEHNLPKPNDPNVRIKKIEAEYVAAIRFGGFANQKDIEKYSQKLKKLLQEKGIETIGNYRFLGYNPPYQLAGRRNEIIVKVNWENR
jgi:hypothetical protein